MSQCDFWLSAAEKAGTKIRASTPKTAKKLKVSHSPSVAFGDSSLSEGACDCACFFLCAAEKAGTKIRASKSKAEGKRKSRTLLQSPSAPAPSRREPMIVRVFSLCRKENKDKIQGSKLKVRTFVFCCSAVGHYEPFWEEGVTRERDGRSLRD